MAQGSAKRTKAAVTLDTNADNCCPWNTTQDCNHVVTIDNQRGDKIYNVMMVARCLWGYATIEGNAEIRKYYAIIGSRQQRTSSHPLGITGLDQGEEREEEIETEIAYFDSTQIEDARISGLPLQADEKETIRVSYELPMI